LDLANLREHIALVSQDIVLLNDTIRANIAFGQSRNTDDSRIKDAAIAAHAWEFIARLPLGLDTLVGKWSVPFRWTTSAHCNCKGDTQKRTHFDS